MSLKSPFESKRKKKTISELLFDKKPNILIKKKNISTKNLKKKNKNNKNVKNDYNNNSNFLFSLCKQDEKNKNEIIFHKKKFTPKKEHHIRYNLNDFNDKNIIRNAPSKISLIQREKSSNNIIPKIKLKPLNVNNKSYILIHPEYNDIKSKNSKLNKKKIILEIILKMKYYQIQKIKILILQVIILVIIIFHIILIFQI